MTIVVEAACYTPADMEEEIHEMVRDFDIRRRNDGSLKLTEYETMLLVQFMNYLVEDRHDRDKNTGGIQKT